MSAKISMKNGLKYERITSWAIIFCLSSLDRVTSVKQVPLVMSSIRAESILSQAKLSIQTTNVVHGHMCYMTGAGLPILPESSRFLLYIVPEMAFWS